MLKFRESIIQVLIKTCNLPHTGSMIKVNKQCLLDTPRTVRASENTWQVIVQTSRP